MDLRTKYTRMVIKNCFFDLLKEKPLSRVTVKGICEKAEINRTTFYRYYSDPFDLMEKIQQELLDAFNEYVEKSKYQNITQSIELVLHAIVQERDIYTILISDNGDRSFLTRILSNSYELFHEGLSRQFPRLSSIQRKWFYSYISQGCISIIFDWIESGMNEPPVEVATFIAEMDMLLFKGLQ